MHRSIHGNPQDTISLPERLWRSSSSCPASRKKREPFLIIESPRDTVSAISKATALYSLGQVGPPSLTTTLRWLGECESNRAVSGCRRTRGTKLSRTEG